MIVDFPFFEDQGFEYPPEADDWCEWFYEFKLRCPNAKCCWTGSRVIGGDTPDSDWDLVVYAGEDIEGIGYELADIVSIMEGEDMYLYRGGSVGSTWLSYKTSDDKLNILLVSSEDMLHRWDNATRLSKAMGLHSKPHRIAMFDYCRTNGTDNSNVEEAPPF